MSNTPFYAPAMRFGNKFGSVPMIDGLAFDGPVTVGPRSVHVWTVALFFWDLSTPDSGSFRKTGSTILLC